MTHRVQSLIESIHAEGSCPRLKVDLTREGIVCPDFVCEQWQEALVIDLDPGYPLNLEFTDTGVDVDLSFGGYVTRCTFPYAAIYLVADRATGKGQLLQENLPKSLVVQPAPEVEVADAPQFRADHGKAKRGEGSRRKRRNAAQEAASAKEAEAKPKRGLIALDPMEWEGSDDEGQDDDEAQDASVADEGKNPEAAQSKAKPASSKPASSKPASPKQASPKQASPKQASPKQGSPKKEKTSSTEDEAQKRRAVFKVIDGGG